MRILLINPPYNRLQGIKEFYFPIGLGYLGSVLEKEGHSVKIYNIDAPAAGEDLQRYKDKYSRLLISHKLYQSSIKEDSHVAWKELREVLKEFNPELIALTSMSCKFQSAVKVAKIFKEHNPLGQVVLGGSHATICPDEAIQNEFIDFLVRGEGEETLIELCTYLEDKKDDFFKIKGLSFKKDGAFFHNEKRAFIKNLDELPFPGRHFIIFKERYPSEAFGTLITMRGCPYRCAFCAAQCTWTRSVRKRNVGPVIDEIKEIIGKYNTHTIFFWDDSFTMDKLRVISLCEEIIQKKLNISWGCCTKVNLLDDDLVKLMKKAGCASMELGVESGSERMLKIIKKDITLPQVRKATQLLDKYHISYTMMLMMGFPEETEEDLKDTIKFIQETKRGFFCLSVFTPYPGTELYETARNLGLIPKKIDWGLLSHHSPENAFTKHIPKDTLVKYIKSMNTMVDKHNSSFKRKIEYVRSRSNFYLNNPKIFISHVTEELKRK